jgi:hypothetical protein
MAAVRRGAKTLPLGKVLGYAEIAEILGVDVKSVRIYRGRDEDFPEPVTPASFRSPGFDEADVQRYKKLREVRRIGKPGRPPRTAVTAEKPTVEIVAKKTNAPATGTKRASASKATAKAQPTAERPNAPARASRAKKTS